MTSARYLTQCDIYLSEIGMKKISTTYIKGIKHWLQNVRIDIMKSCVAVKSQRLVADCLCSVFVNRLEEDKNHQ